MSFDKLFGDKPLWLQRLLRRRGRDAFNESKHARGKTKPRDYAKKRKTRRKMAQASRRINRGS